MSQCLATSKRSGLRCRNHATRWSEYCRMHGGSPKQPRGSQLAHTTHGRYSKYLPVDLVPRYEEYRSAADILALHDEIALVDLRISELLNTAQAGGVISNTALMELIDSRRKLVSTERRRLVDMQQMMTAEQVMILLASITDTVKRHVRDPDTLDAISDELARLVNRRAFEEDPGNTSNTPTAVP